MREDKTGVLLVNLGTPDVPNTSGVKCFLKQFLSDKRVIDIPQILWWPLLNIIILPLRSLKISKYYKDIWMNEGSPLIVYSRRQNLALSKKLNIPVALGMTYGNPSLKSAIDTLFKQGIKRLIVLTLYPQFSSATVAAAWDAISNVFKGYRSLPSVYFVRDYADHPYYISALHSSVKRSFKLYGKPDVLVISFHGIPQRFVKEGDDYLQRCHDTFIALTNSLKLHHNEAIMTFQSQFGYEPWLKPYTKDVIKMLAKKNIKHIHIISPGFSTDCLETLHEINIENRKIFLNLGGKHFIYIPALNDDKEHISMMREIINDSLIIKNYIPR